MKKAQGILGLVILLFAGLSTAACENNGAGNRNYVYTPKITVCEGEENVGGFSLTISVENPIVQQGDIFQVNIELKNNNEEDKEIIHYQFFLFFKACIPNWDPTYCGKKGHPYYCGCPEVDIEMPVPQSTLLEAGGVIQQTGRLINSSSILKGTHDLRFSAVFGTSWSEFNEQPIEVWSNTITLTVQ